MLPAETIRLVRDAHVIGIFAREPHDWIVSAVKHGPCRANALEAVSEIPYIVCVNDIRCLTYRGSGGAFSFELPRKRECDSVK